MSYYSTACKEKQTWFSGCFQVGFPMGLQPPRGFSSGFSHGFTSPRNSASSQRDVDQLGARSPIPSCSELCRRTENDHFGDFFGLR